MFFLEFSCFLYDLMNVGNLISGSFAFSKPSLYIWKLFVPYFWSLTSRILSITLLAWEMTNCLEVWTLALPFFGTAMKTDLFQFCGHCWVFQICWHTECRTLTALSFRILKRSVEIPSLSLALFVVRLPMVHLTSHSRLSGSKWVTTQSWLSGSLRIFFCIALLYILATSSQSLLLLLGPYYFCPLLCSFLHEMFPDISNFLEDIASPSHSIVFLYFIALFT